MENALVTYQPLDYTDLTEQTYRALKDKILRYELKPGAQISVSEVAFALGVSRTPVMDALKRLASEGLVEIAPRRGTFVTELTTRDIAEIFDMRLMIELYAAELLFQTGAVDRFIEAAQAPMQAMQRAIAGADIQDYDAFTSNDRDFHTALITLTRNNRLLRAYTQLRVHTHGARVHFLDGDNIQQAQHHHTAIVEAFRHGRVDQAKEALRIHIATVKARMLDLLEQRGGKL